MNESSCETAPIPEAAVNVRGYDFFDFGCSKGGNIAYTNRIYPGLRGLGMDIDHAKIRIARESGHDAEVFDLLTLPPEKLVRFVTMSHFLEHLHTVEDAQKMISRAVSVSESFVAIRQPWFDSDAALSRLGLKFYWSHWSGHRNMMTSSDFHSIVSSELDCGRIARFALFGRGVVKDSSHSALIPIDAPINQHDYDPVLHGPKPLVDLPFPAFKEVVALVQTGPECLAGPLMEKLGPLHLLHDSESVDRRR